MSTQLLGSIVRVCQADNKVVGAGFLVGQGQILTCAHVIAQALGIPETSAQMPVEPVYLNFPLIAPDQMLRARVICWHPCQGDDRGDIAGLQLEGNPPTATQIVHLVSAADLWGHRFRAFGFPSGYDNGVWASGLLRGPQATGWVLIEDVKEQGYWVMPGFSGAPVWDEELQGIAGMVVGAERRPELRAAYIIPAAQLAEAWSAQGVMLKVEIVKAKQAETNKSIEVVDSRDIQTGLHALVNLMQRPEIRDVVAKFQADFQTVYDQIEAVNNYKKLHDQLHSLEFTCYQSIVSEAKRFPDNDSIENLKRHAFDLYEIIRQLQTVARGKVLPVSELTWINDIREAHATLRQTLKGTQQSSLEDVIWLLHRTLAIYPSRINTCLNQAAHALRLGKLETALITIWGKLGQLADSDPEKIAQFSSGADSFSRLNVSFNGLIENHDGWQEVDLELRRIETEMERGLKDLTRSWPRLKEKVAPLCRNTEADWAQWFKEYGDELDQALLTPQDVNTIRNSFQDYRRQAGIQFFEVDLILKNQCEELLKISEPLHAVLRMLT